MARATFRIWRGDADKGGFQDYPTNERGHGRARCRSPDPGRAGERPGCPLELQSGQMRVVLRGDQRQSEADVHDAAEHARSQRAGHRRTDQAFPLIKDLVTDVSWNFQVKKTSSRSSRASRTRPTAHGGCSSAEVDRVQEFRKCIECFLCQDVCHILRDHHLHDEFIGPRFLLYNAALEMHPLDTEDRLADLKGRDGIGFCNITRCCTKVCPEHITITENAIIPLKERVVDEFYDPLTKLLRIFRGDPVSDLSI